MRSPPMTRQQMLNHRWNRQHRSGKCRCLRVGVVPDRSVLFLQMPLHRPGRHSAGVWRETCAVNGKRDTGHRIASDSEFELKLARKASGKAVDGFVRSEAFGSPKVQTDRGSYQRIPDGGTRWRNLTYSSKATENVIFDLEQTRHFAFWAWKAHLPSLMADDHAMMKL